MSDESNVKMLRYVVWDGKKEGYSFWKIKCMARARRLKFRHVLLMKASDIPKESDAKTDEQKALVELNVCGFEDLTLSIDTSKAAGKVVFEIIKSCMTDECPDGNCPMAWASLENRMESKTATSLLKLLRKYTASKCPKHDNPEAWIVDL